MQIKQIFRSLPRELWQTLREYGYINQSTLDAYDIINLVDYTFPDDMPRLKRYLTVADHMSTSPANVRRAVNRMNREIPATNPLCRDERPVGLDSGDAQCDTIKTAEP